MTQTRGEIDRKINNKTKKMSINIFGFWEVTLRSSVEA
jgi:hypothetical protein